MGENGLEALIATSPANVFYTSDCYPYGKSYTLIPLDAGVEPALVTPISGTTPTAVMSPPWFKDIRYYGEFYVTTSFAEDPLTEVERKMIEAHERWAKSRETDPVALLVEILKERGITEGTVGVDESAPRSEDPFWEKMKAALPSLNLIKARNVFREIRMIKTSEEVKRIQKALEITGKAWDNSLENVYRGITEKAFAEIFRQTIISEGGYAKLFGIYWPPIAFGRRTAFSDVALPTEYRLRKGDIIRFDGGCVYKGYPSDFARSAVYGEPSEKLKTYWKAIFNGEQVAIDMARPGTEAAKIFKKVVKEVRRSGIPHYRRHHTGHGWGLEGYDPPAINPRDHTKLQEGMVLCFETPYYEVGWGGILHEDVVEITEDGSRYLTTKEEELRVVG